MQVVDRKPAHQHLHPPSVAICPTYTFTSMISNRPLYCDLELNHVFAQRFNIPPLRNRRPKRNEQEQNTGARTTFRATGARSHHSIHQRSIRSGAGDGAVTHDRGLAVLGARLAGHTRVRGEEAHGTAARGRHADGPPASFPSANGTIPHPTSAALPAHISALASAVSHMSGLAHTLTVSCEVYTLE